MYNYGFIHTVETFYNDHPWDKYQVHVVFMCFCPISDYLKMKVPFQLFCVI